MKNVKSTEMPLKDCHDNKAYRQFSSGEFDRDITISTGSDGVARIAKRMTARLARNTAAVMNFRIDKMFKRKEGQDVALFYCLSGEFDNATLSFIEDVSRLIYATFHEDEVAIFNRLHPETVEPFEMKLGISRSIIYYHGVVRFEKPFDPGADFVEVF